MTGNIPYISREQTENLLKCFTEAIQQPESNPLLFNVWGIGGVGKTTLLNKLSEQHPEIKFAFARVYFGSTPDIGTPLKLMANLYSQLPPIEAIDEWGQETEIFTTLYQQYEETLSQLKEPEKKESETQATERKEAIKKLVGGGAKTLSKFIPVAKDLPGVEDKIGSMAEGGVDLVDWLGKRKITKKDKELQALMLEPIPKLTEAFVAGLVAKSANQPIVLLLDTYEKTNREIDDWLWQYLIANPKLKLHPIRILVAGRNKLLKKESWRKLKQDFSLVDDLEIKRFSLEQTQAYLEELGIAEAEVEKIYQATKGLPYYLNWIREQQKKGKTLDFSQGNQQITRLLLQGLNRQQEQIIQLAACCCWFDRALIEDLITSPSLEIANVVEPQIDYFEWLQQLDFVEFVQHTYRLDDVARDVFRRSLWQEDREKFYLVNKLLADYFERKANQEVTADSSPRLQYENDEWRGYK
jgi:GTPase SAR1 family protein